MLKFVLIDVPVLILLILSNLVDTIDLRSFVTSSMNEIPLRLRCIKRLIPKGRRIERKLASTYSWEFSSNMADDSAVFVEPDRCLSQDAYRTQQPLKFLRVQLTFW